MNYSRGNILFIILIAIALFGALSFAVSQSKTGTAKNMSGEKLTIKVDQLLEYAQNVRSAVNFIYTHNNISESDIRFAHPKLDAAYGDYTALNSEQMVFDPSGGGIDYKPIDTGLLDGTHSAEPGYGTAYFTITSNVLDVGTTLQDLVMFVPYLSQEACATINKKLGISDMPEDWASIDETNYITNMYDGTYPVWNGIGDDGYPFANLISGRLTICYRSDSHPVSTGSYNLMQVLLER
ncbi:MAG: hypothetical protein CMH32_08425 [Micavibrio sp.]|nr:hypothetical protein [Micavibrio sp.]